MSITRKIIDLAKSNLNALLERAADTADPRRKLQNVSDAELEAELARRKAQRAAAQRVADAKRQVAGDREARERAARERVERVKAEREARARAAGGGSSSSSWQQRTASSGPRWAGTGGGRSGTGAGTGAGTGGGGSARAARDPELKKHYETLEIPVGSDWETVKAAYRRLMRKYHPDMHANKSPEKQKAANEVSTALTTAYNELERALTKK
jgi:DnaJ-domain-containing protein 1